MPVFGVGGTNSRRLARLRLSGFDKRLRPRKKTPDTLSVTSRRFSPKAGTAHSTRYVTEVKNGCR